MVSCCLVIYMIRLALSRNVCAYVEIDISNYMFSKCSGFRYTCRPLAVEHILKSCDVTFGWKNMHLQHFKQITRFKSNNIVRSDNFIFKIHKSFKEVGVVYPLDTTRPFTRNLQVTSILLCPPFPVSGLTNTFDVVRFDTRQQSTCIPPAM
jgi:hypothetical protein